MLSCDSHGSSLLASGSKLRRGSRWLQHHMQTQPCPGQEEQPSVFSFWSVFPSVIFLNEMLHTHKHIHRLTWSLRWGREKWCYFSYFAAHPPCPLISFSIFSSRESPIQWFSKCSLDQQHHHHPRTCSKCRINFFIFLFFVFRGPYPQDMEVPRLGVKSDLQQPAYTTAIATQDLSSVCDLYHSSWQPWILNPWARPGIWTHILMDPSPFWLGDTTGTPSKCRILEASPHRPCLQKLRAGPDDLQVILIQGQVGELLSNELNYSPVGGHSSCFQFLVIKTGATVYPFLGVLCPVRFLLSQNLLSLLFHLCSSSWTLEFVSKFQSQWYRVVYIL